MSQGERNMEIVLTPKSYDEIINLINEIEMKSFLQGKHSDDEEFAEELEQEIIDNKRKIKRIFYGSINFNHKQTQTKR